MPLLRGDMHVLSTSSQVLDVSKVLSDSKRDTMRHGRVIWTRLHSLLPLVSGQRGEVFPLSWLYYPHVVFVQKAFTHSMVSKYLY